jgi:transcriptional regulator with GAF, ATPase, and Fis domain
MMPCTAASYSSSSDWRSKMNRAVRQCVTSLDLLVGGAATTPVTIMLGEVGEALTVDCASLIEFSDQGRAIAGYDWHRPIAAGQPAQDISALLGVIQQLKVERAPIVIGENDAQVARVPGARTFLRRAGLRSAAIVPAGLGQRLKCAWAFGVRRDEEWSESLIDHMGVLGDILAAALGRRGTCAVRQEPPPPSSSKPPPALRRSDDIVGDSAALRAALRKMEEVATTESTVLLLGETGTGKELFARALHARGRRRAAPLVSVNCGALPPTLIESELFGHERGAFTGAVAPRQGRFELADRGTLFLDEIGDLPLDLQAKLLRVLQEGTFERVGSSRSQPVDVRIVAATHHNLIQSVADGTFRADLFYRLNVFPIRLPSLRERPEDIPALVWSIIHRRQQAIDRRVTKVPDEVMVSLQRHSWPGNVRELENVVERALIHSSGDTLTLLDEPADVPAPVPADASTTLVSIEKTHIEEVLRTCDWRINGMGNAAERLGLHPNTLRFRMKKLGIVRLESLRPRRSWATRGGASPAIARAIARETR